MTTQDPDDQIQQMLLEASVHPSLSRIDPSLLARAQQLLAPRKMGFDPGIEPEHRQRLINHLRQEAFDLLDGFPSLDEEGLEDREIRVDAHAVAEELAARTEGLCVDSIGLGAGAADIDFDGIALHVDAPGDEDGTTLCVRLVDAEDFTLAPDAPAGPASALAVACALVQRTDALLARARALVLAPRAGSVPEIGMLTMTAAQLEQRIGAGEVFDGIVGDSGGAATITGPVQDTVGFITVETEFGVLRYEPDHELVLAVVPDAARTGADLSDQED